MLSFILVSFLSSVLLSFLATPVIRALAPWLGLVDKPGFRKVHITPTPMGGGIAVFIGVVFPAVVLFTFPRMMLEWSPTLDRVRQELNATPEVLRQMCAILIGGVILFLVGLTDDRWGLSWKIRLSLQLGVATAVTFAGVQATFFAAPWIGIVGTIVWIIVLTNAMNFLDNMDGLSAGIGVISAALSAGILLTLVGQPHWTVAFALLLLTGSLCGFLCWNRPPASIFMGDSGSNLIGFLLATLTVSGTFYDRAGSRHVILAPLCVLAIPLYDFATVILIRLREGRSPFHGDKSHFSHRLVELGLRPARAVLTIHLATLLTGLGGLLLYKVSDWTGAWLIIAMISCVLSLVTILETVGRRSLTESQARNEELESSSRSRSDGPPAAVNRGPNHDEVIV